jgi:hypothetical protein
VPGKWSRILNSARAPPCRDRFKAGLPRPFLNPLSFRNLSRRAPMCKAMRNLSTPRAFIHRAQIDLLRSISGLWAPKASPQYQIRKVLCIGCRGANSLNRWQVCWPYETRKACKSSSRTPRRSAQVGSKSRAKPSQHCSARCPPTSTQRFRLMQGRFRSLLKTIQTF